MKTDHEFDFAVSYAGPDQPFVEEVVSALRARGLRVFFAPDEQADMLGRNLLDYLHEVYLSKAKYCLLFASKYYAERKWTNKVERTAAQERALGQDDRYIIPIRLDDTKITALSGNTLDIRNASPKRVADLCVAVLLRDETPAAVSDLEEKRDRLILRVISFTEFDVDLLRQSFKPFSGLATGNANMISVELRLPRFFMETLEKYEAIKTSPEFKKIDLDTQHSFGQGIDSIRITLFQELMRAPQYVLGQSQPLYGSSLILTESAIELLRRYILSKVIAAARCLVAFRLKGFWQPSWAVKLADCDTIWSPTVMRGLPWLCRAEGSERYLWFDSDIHAWGPGIFHEKVRVYRPSSLVVRRRADPPTPDEVLAFIGTQLLERELEGRTPQLLNDAFLYPERMEVSSRNENVVECHHFHEVNTHGSGCKPAFPAIVALGEEILKQGEGSREKVCHALELIYSAEFALRDQRDLLLPAIKMLYSRLSAYDARDQSS